MIHISSRSIPMRIVCRNSATRALSSTGHARFSVATSMTPYADAVIRHSCIRSPMMVTRHISAASFATSPAAAASSPSTPSISLPPLPLFQHFLNKPGFLEGDAIGHIASSSGPSDSSLREEKRWTYRSLLTEALAVRSLLQSRFGSDLKDIPVAFLYTGSASYVSVLLGIWSAGGIAVPLHQAHAKPELEYLVQDSKARIILVSKELEHLARGIDKGKLCEDVVTIDPTQLAEKESQKPSTQQQQHAHSQSQPQDPESWLSRRAMFIYTSGTTGKPKGVVWTHRMFHTQMSILSSAWQWSQTDHILHVLPLHHVHGVLNVLLCAIYNGAKVSFLSSSKANTSDIASALSDRNLGLTLFMAVPTIYSRLLTHYSSLSPDGKSAFRSALSQLRLMVSGSSALPAPVLEQWRAATGHTLLERYGMSETGMMLSQSLDPHIREKQSGTVGWPLDTVEVRVVPVEGDAASSATASSAATDSEVGELRVRGPSVFREYWQLPEKTASEFDEDGWFKTGDIVERTETGYKILGRASVDVLKSAGYKISALDVERELLGHPDITEVAVVGVPSIEYGQIVAAIVALKPGSSCSSAESLSKWSRQRLASYQVPRLWRIVGSIPRNAMGKTNKKELLKIFDNQTKK